MTWHGRYEDNAKIYIKHDKTFENQFYVLQNGRKW